MGRAGASPLIDGPEQSPSPWLPPLPWRITALWNPTPWKISP